MNTYTGDGLEAALENADTVIDLTNSSYTDFGGAIEFFYASTLNLLTFGAAAGVTHHIALSVVGTERLANSEGGYFKAKAQQEDLIRSSGQPYSIVHSTQFFEFLASLADSATDRGVVRVSQALVQPIAADDIADAVVAVALGSPLNRVVEFAGPDRFRLEDAVRTRLAGRYDPREVVADPLARYFGADLSEGELLPSESATITSTHFNDWLRDAA